MKKFNWKEYLTFSKKERRFAICTILIVAALTAVSIYFQGKDDEDSVTTLFDKQLTDSTQSLLTEKDSTEKPVNHMETISNKQLFTFDPNTLDENGWKKLGLSDRVIHTIINYRNKGGRFYKPEDIRKIYGINAETAEELIPYITVKSNKHNDFEQKNLPENNIRKESPAKKYSSININSATEEDWKSLPGIGDVLSKRIVKFRNSKGGFTSVDEVAKTYGLQDSVFQKIRPYLKMDE